MKPRRSSLEIERAAAHLIRARTALDEAAHVLAALSDAPGDRLAISASLAGEQARLAEALAAAIHAPPHTALDDLVAALCGDAADARSKRH
ncbi:MAG: hypothetical protein Q8M31_17735 [Beijerinckiaceae bacterium]|nr:hypothetical protein [Beijerinckiaceae bacterium]